MGCDSWKATEPVAAELRVLADGDIGDIHVLGAIREFRPCRSGRAIPPERFLEGGAIPGLFVNAIQDAGAELRAKKPAEAGLNRNVGCQATQLGRLRATGLVFSLGQIFGRGGGMVLDPLRYLNR